MVFRKFNVLFTLGVGIDDKNFSLSFDVKGPLLLVSSGGGLDGMDRLSSSSVVTSLSRSSASLCTGTPHSSCARSSSSSLLSEIPETWYAYPDPSIPTNSSSTTEIQLHIQCLTYPRGVFPSHTNNQHGCYGVINYRIRTRILTPNTMTTLYYAENIRIGLEP